MMCMVGAVIDSDIYIQQYDLVVSNCFKLCWQPSHRWTWGCKDRSVQQMQSTATRPPSCHVKKAKSWSYPFKDRVDLLHLCNFHLWPLNHGLCGDTCMTEPNLYKPFVNLTLSFHRSFITQVHSDLFSVPCSPVCSSSVQNKMQ